MSAAPGVSVMLIARNEAARIERALRSVAWADEIVVVVDAASVDATEQIARDFGCRVWRETFVDFAAQRQHALDHATQDWGLWMDCDEEVSEELAGEVRKTLEAPACSSYRVPRLDHMFGKWIRHGGWYPQYHVRLFRREGSRWEGAVHERVVTAGAVGTLKGEVRHFSHTSVSNWVDKMVRYTPMEAEAWSASGKRANPVSILTEPVMYFGYKYIVQQGWRDGIHGLVLATLMGCYRLLVLLQLWDLRRKRP